MDVDMDMDTANCQLMLPQLPTDPIAAASKTSSQSNFIQLWPNLYQDLPYLGGMEGLDDFPANLDEALQQGVFERDDDYSLWDYNYTDSNPTSNKEPAPTAGSDSISSDEVFSSSSHSSISDCTSASTLAPTGPSSTEKSSEASPTQQPNNKSTTKNQRRQRRPSTVEAAYASSPGGPETRLSKIRHRNRIAAGKCRDKKRNATELLKDEHKRLKGTNDELTSTLEQLKVQRLHFKDMIVQHGNCDCELIQKYLNDFATSWVHGVE